MELVVGDDVGVGLVVGDDVGVGLVVGDVVGLVVGDEVRKVVDCCVLGVDAADLEGVAVVTEGVGEPAVAVGAGLLASPASVAVAVAPPFPPPGLCDVSRTAATATMITAAAAVTSQGHRRRRDGGLRGGSGGMLAPLFCPMSSGPENGTRDVSEKPWSSRVAEAAPAAAAPTTGSR